VAGFSRPFSVRLKADTTYNLKADTTYNLKADTTYNWSLRSAPNRKTVEILECLHRSVARRLKPARELGRGGSAPRYRLHATDYRLAPGTFTLILASFELAAM
jgi:hypothetical protein